MTINVSIEELRDRSSCHILRTCRRVKDNALQGELLAHSVGIRRKDWAADRLAKLLGELTKKGARRRPLYSRSNAFTRCETSSTCFSGGRPRSQRQPSPCRSVM